MAAVMLFTSLAMPWDLSSDSNDRWWVVISVLAALAALVVPYVAKAGVLPGWSRRHVRVTKAALAVPLLASVAAALVNELVNVTSYFGGGLGSGIAMAVAGAVLAVSPREADEEPGSGGIWVSATRVTVVATVALGLATFVAYFVDGVTGYGGLLDDLPMLLVILMVRPLLFLAVVGIPAVGLLNMKPDSQRTFVVVAGTWLVVSLFALNNSGTGLFGEQIWERWNSPVAALVLAAPAGALAVTRPVRRLVAQQMDPFSSWIRTADLALLVVAIGQAIRAAADILRMAALGDFTATGVVSLVLVVGSAVAALVARATLNSLPRQRPMLLVLLGGILLAGIITVAVEHNRGSQLSGWEAALWFSLPVLATYAVTMPTPVRTSLGPIVTPSTTSYPAAGGGGWSQPAAPRPPAAGPPPPPAPAQPPAGPPPPPAPPPPAAPGPRYDPPPSGQSD
ncbi:hypothetical protein [Nocardioides sp.]|uniref:DUF7937 domain-containing protein n=1 Tax=Nocardioides sp. TaxID=35761 RepID=UPI00352869BB